MPIRARAAAFFSRLVSPVTRSLSGRLLMFTIFFVMVSEVFVYVPSIANYHADLLKMRLASAQIAVLPLDEPSGNQLSPELRREMLANAGVIAVALKRTDTRELYLSHTMPETIDATFDTRGMMFPQLAWDAFDTLTARAGRIIRIVGTPRLGGGEYIDVVMDETPVREELFSYSWRIFLLSLFISILTAALVYVTLHWLLVRPMQRLTEAMLRFRARPEDAGSALLPTGRVDEIGIAEATLAEMQSDLRKALHQRAHLAALGVSVAKINHDLRNILSSAQLASDRLAASEDPTVQKLAPRLMAAIDRAVELTTATLRYARAEDTAPHRRRVNLMQIVEEVAGSVAPGAHAGIVIDNKVPDDLEADADPDQLFRILMNIVRNAVQVLEAQGQGRVSVIAMRGGGRVYIDIADTGPGIPEKARVHLFEPFAGSTRSGGTGLGLAIAKELAVAHGGDLALIRTGAEGTVFRITIPDADKESR